MPTEAEQYAQAEEAARQWQPGFVRDGTGLLPDATPIRDLLIPSQRPMESVIHRPMPPQPDFEMEMPGNVGAAPSPPPPEGSGDDPGP